jgi:hypothetical protein
MKLGFVNYNGGEIWEKILLFKESNEYNNNAICQTFL